MVRVGGDLAEKIGALSDADAIAALAFVLDVEDASNEDMAQLEAEQDKLPEALNSTPDLGEVASPDAQASKGDLARSVLSYLAGQEATGDLVAKAVNRLRPAGKRDPLTFAIGGLVLLALKTEVELKRSPAGKWTFHFRLKPTKDTALAGILTKMWGLFGGGQG
jgi:hypothetical protein